ncbi:MAG: lysylphosphatidylglycerol synthase transmembrane domain-containing protein [Peptoniphilaceae bacterium]|nr:lysylphosphatidylglycerol synthase transmembrane domain-containing protein [Peptoniphilaceae bacterium]
MREKAKKTIINFLILLGLSFGMIYLIYRKTNPKDLKAVFFAMKKEYIVYAILAFILYRLMEGLALYVLFKKVRQDTSIRACMAYSIFGHFFSQLTPSGGGGQPAQLYLMTKDGIKGDKALAAMVPFNIMYHISLPIVGLIALSTQLRWIIFSSNLSFFFYIGLLVQVFLAIVVILAFKKTTWLLNLLVFISEKIKGKRFFDRFYRSKDRIRAFLEDLKKNMLRLVENKEVFIIIFILQALMLFFNYTMSYFTYRAMGFSDYSLFDIVRIQCLIIIATEYIPTPGTAGFSELALYEAYKNIIAKDYALSWMMLNRILPLYLAILFTLIIYIIRSVREKNNSKEV